MRLTSAVFLLVCSTSVFAQTQVPVTVDVPITMPNGSIFHATGTGWATIPTNTPPPPPPGSMTLCYGGQSNMNNALPFFRGRGYTLFGYAEGAQSIVYWSSTGAGWAAMINGGGPIAGQSPLSNHSECKSFEWFQGESDNGGDMVAMSANIVNLMGRVRTAIGSATVQIHLAQLNQQYTGPNWAITDACSKIQFCTVVVTGDLSFADGIHLDNNGMNAYITRTLALP